MRCKKIKILLSDYIDDRLDEKKKGLVEHHLESCGNCRNDYSNLQNYKNYALSVQSVSPPGNLKEDTWMAISNKTVITQNKINIKSRYLIISWTAVAAAILILILIIPAVNNPQSITMDINYVLSKKGKGPSVSIIHARGTDPRPGILYGISDSFNCRIENIKISPGDIIDGLGLQIPKDNYNEFREAINSLQISDQLPQLEFKRKRGFVNVQLYFSGRKFFIGDFNNDGFDDYGAYFNRGRHSGEFYLALNDTTANFNSPERAVLNDSLQYVYRSDDILCGDFNNDGFDDLIIRFSKGINSGAWLIYFNNHKGGFMNGVDWNSGEKKIDNNDWNIPFVGDFNADGFDDIGTHYRRGKMEGEFVISYNKKDKSFADPVIFETGHTGLGAEKRYTPLVLDMNGDGYSDIMIYWQGGERNAYWYFSINNRDGRGDTETYAAFGKGYRAFEGHYLSFTGDMNNDGYDELLVKIGSSDEIGNWYMMENCKDSSFTSDQFRDFNGEIDFIIR